MDENKKQNLKITIVLLIVFLIGLSTLLFLSNFETRGSNIDINKKDIFFSKDFSDNSIFILGSSQIAPLNATSINQILNNGSETSFEVYNLAYAGNAPFREQFDNELVEIHPKLVIYGISYRDFEFSKSDDFENSIFPNVKDVVEYQLLRIGDDKIPLNPQFLVRTMLRDSTPEINQNSFDRMNRENTPFYFYKQNPVLKTHEDIIKDISNSTRNNILDDVSHPFKKHSEKFLELFIEKMQENSIDIILVSTPLPDIAHYDDKLKTDYEKFFKKLENKYKIPIFRFDTTYQGLDVWQDVSHISYHPSVSEFNSDISKIIQDEVK